MRIRELDGLRGIAVLAVLDCHLMAWYPRLGAAFGWLGVDLFFVLSGFLITSILLDLKEKENYFQVFYSRRALRIFPPYFLGLAVYIAVSLASGMPGNPKLWLSYIFYSSSLFQFDPAHPLPVPSTIALGLAVLWSLSVEEIYYTIWAPLVRYATEKFFTAVLLLMIVAAPVLRWRLHTHDHWEILTFYCRMDGLAYGSVVALLARYRRSVASFAARWDRTFDVLLLLFLGLSSIAAVVFGGNAQNIVTASLGVTIADLLFALLTFALVRHAGGAQWWVRLFRMKWLRSTGMISYSLYLFHYPLYAFSGDIVARMNWSRHASTVSQVLLGLGLSFAVAYGLWYGMESRILKWKDRNVPSPAHAADLVEAEAVSAVQ